MAKTYTTPPNSASYDIYRESLTAPHLMIAGASGSGKSVLENALIYTALRCLPGNQAGGVRLILIDLKRTELCQYRALPHTMYYASEPEDVLPAFSAAVDAINARYADMQRRGLRTYDGGDIYVIVDEFADLMTTQGREVKPLVQRIAQIGRASKVHLILCTQCPLAKVIPTEIKVNFDSRWALRTSSRRDSRNIMDDVGCERLPNPRTEHRALGYYCDGADRTLYRLPMYTDEQIAERVSWWARQSKSTARPGLLDALIRRFKAR